jgi:hypothetical protein
MSAPYYATAGRSQPESNDATDDGSAEGMDAYCKDEYLIGQQFDPNSFKGRF